MGTLSNKFLCDEILRISVILDKPRMPGHVRSNEGMEKLYEEFIDYSTQLAQRVLDGDGRKP